MRGINEVAQIRPMWENQSADHDNPTDSRREGLGISLKIHQKDFGRESVIFVCGCIRLSLWHSEGLASYCVVGSKYRHFGLSESHGKVGPASCYFFSRIQRINYL